jgi:hypothetical protein
MCGGNFEEGDDMTETTTAVITPAAALARHIEWLEFALAAARSEETWRAGRLEKATKKSREKRALRLVEVRDEIAELAALIDGIRGLQAGAPSRSRSTSTRRRAAAKPAVGARKRPASARKPRSSATTPVAAASSVPTATATPAATAGSGKVASAATAGSRQGRIGRSRDREALDSEGVDCEASHDEAGGDAAQAVDLHKTGRHHDATARQPTRSRRAGVIAGRRRGRPD